MCVIKSATLASIVNNLNDIKFRDKVETIQKDVRQKQHGKIMR